MYIDQKVSARTIIALLKKVIPSRKSIDRHLINNVRLNALSHIISTQYLLLNTTRMLITFPKVNNIEIVYIRSR